MRYWFSTFLLAAAVTLMSCDTQTTPRRDDEAARQAGREAYRASKDLKRDAKEAARELHNAGKEFREGWTQAQHEDEARRK